MKNWNKIFEIGDPKTGTSSLGKAFEILGLKIKGFDLRLLVQCKKKDFKKTLKTIENFDAFYDGPWHDFELYKLFDKKFPKSKFIILERDISDWIKSFEYHFSAEKHPIKKKYIDYVYNFNEKRDKIIKMHLNSYEKIKAYFRNRPNDLLVMNICSGDGWEKLCPFLGLPVPNKPFPFENKTKAYKKVIKNLFFIFKRLSEKLILLKQR